MHTSDLELLRRVRHGDESAFAELVDRYANHLFGVAFTLTGNAADAEDAVQETLAGALLGSAAFREEASVKTWLVRILVRQCARGRRGRRAAIPIHGGHEELAGGGGPLATASGEMQVDVRMDVMQMLETLSPEHRQVIVLREIEQMSYEEMAQVLAVPRGTVESRLHRARQELRERFKGYL